MPGGSKDIKAGGAYILLTVRSKLTEGLKRASGQLKAFGSTTRSIGMGITAAAAGLGGAFIPAISAASDMEETMSKFSTVFGDQSDAVKDWSDTFASEVGRSKQQIASFMAGTQDLFVPLGFEPGAATAMSKQLTSLAVDLGSFNNMADDAVLRDLHAALTGSGEVMKKYGVLVSEAAVKQELLRQGMDPKTATDQQKVMARLSIIMAGTTAAQGDAIRTSGSFANQMKRLKANVSDLAVEVGNALLPIVTDLVTRASDAISTVMKWVGENKGLIIGIAGLAAGLAAAGGLTIALGVAATALGTALGAIAPLFAALLSPMSLAVAGIAAATYSFLTFTETGRGIASEISRVFGNIWSTVKMTMGGIADALAAGDIKLAVEILWAGIKMIWFEGLYAISDAWGTITQSVGKFATSVLDRMGIIGQGIMDAWGWIKSNILDTLGVIANAIMHGEFSIAGEVAWTSIKLAFVQGISFVQNAWNEFTTGMVTIFDSTVVAIRTAWNDTISFLAKLMLQAVDMTKKAFDAIAQYDPSGLAAQISASLDVDTEGALAALEDDRQRFAQQLRAAKEARDTERANKLNAQLSETEAQLAALREQRDAAMDRARDATAGGFGKALTDAGADMLNAIDKASKAASTLDEQEKKLGDAAGGALGMPGGGGAAAGGGGAVETAFFSAAAAMAAFGPGGGRSDAEEQTAQNTKQTNRVLSTVKNVLQEIRDAFEE